MSCLLKHFCILFHFFPKFRLINSKNNQQRQQYIREKLNNFGQRKSDDRRMFKREADPSLMTYTVATSHPMMSFNNYR